MASEPTTSVVPDYKEAGLGSKFVALVKKRQEIHDEMEALKGAKDAVSERVMAMLQASGVPSVMAAGWRVTRSEGKKVSKRLDEKLLIRNGVTADVIAKSKVEGEPGSPYLVVTKEGGR